MWGDNQDKLLPICNPAGSDSANLDRVAELLIQTEFDVEPTMMLLVPEAYDNHPELDEKYPEVKDFYKYFQGMHEGWDRRALDYDGALDPISTSFIGAEQTGGACRR